MGVVGVVVVVVGWGRRWAGGLAQQRGGRATANQERSQERMRTPHAHTLRRTHTRSCLLTDHVVGNMDLDLALRLEGHLAFNALVRLLLQ